MTEPLLVVNISHVIEDGLSFNIALRELIGARNKKMQRICSKDVNNLNIDLLAKDLRVIHGA